MSVFLQRWCHWLWFALGWGTLALAWHGGKVWPQDAALLSAVSTMLLFTSGFGLRLDEVGPRNDDWIKLLSAQDVKRRRVAKRATIENSSVFDRTTSQPAVLDPAGSARATWRQFRRWGPHTKKCTCWPARCRNGLNKAKLTGMATGHPE